MKNLYEKRLKAGLLMIKGFISRLVNLLTITQQDLDDAGVNHRYYR